jgi:O-antigen ligase
MAHFRLASKLNETAQAPVTPFRGYRALVTILAVSGLVGIAVVLYLAPELATIALVLLGLGLPIFFLLWHRPEAGLLALIFLSGSFVPANIIDLRLPIGGGLDLRDLVLIGLFGITLLQGLSRSRLTVPWWPVGGSLLVFLSIAMFSAFYALFFEHVESNWALSDLRILSLYLTFYITLWSIKRREQLKFLLAGLFLIADLTTVIVYLQQFLGAGHPLLQAMMITRDWRVYETVGAVRVVPAGQVLMHFMWFIALGILIFARPGWRLKAFCVMELLFLGGGHLYSYMRAQWIALIIGLGLVFIVLIPKFKKDLTKAAVITYCVALVLVGAIVIASGPLPETSATPFVRGITQRFASIFTPADTAETGSLEWRDFELEKALQALQKQPLTGVGLGNRYRELTSYQSESSGRLTRGSIAAGEVSRFTRYVHNSYGSIAVKMGIPGLLALLWFCTAVLVKGFQVYRDMPDVEYRGVVLGVLVAFAGLLFWSYFHAHLIKAESTATIGLMVAVVGSIAYTAAPSSILRPTREHTPLAKG